MKRYTTVDDYIAGAVQFKQELVELRALLNATELNEGVKWGFPCYTIGGKNVVGLGAFKSYVGLWFFQGALLADEQELLVSGTEGRTRAQRQMRFQSPGQINKRVVKKYVQEAIKLAKQGIEIKPERNQPVTVPRPLKDAFAKDKKAKAAFDKLTPGRRREYAEYIAEAKRPETQQARLAKIIPMIVAGVGLNDKYRNG